MQFLGKLWRGEYPLWISFWCFGCAVGYILFAVFIFSLSASIKRMGAESLGAAELVFLCSFIVFPAYMVVALRGIWKSAEQYEGVPFWKGAAKLAVIMACIKFVRFTYEGLASLGLV
ncbi:hypothetical protein [Halodesulfovibrio spirochaetisodalis]|uniref:Uncharacterized protein n=1 Tax=Halodesulfovibrio spirochaetisodalis TaxID=1560234 RepID=A0A1B7XA21_9BACT|nr:hypothetical protein [Halodesulfovibrio spirochaetisodalis]OBQ46239.1 hypothetical protein SP90_13665 [Halodesulfovibrio spirochaetisodalis]